MWANDCVVPVCDIFNFNFSCNIFQLFFYIAVNFINYFIYFAFPFVVFICAFCKNKLFPTNCCSLFICLVFLQEGQTICAAIINDATNTWAVSARKHAVVRAKPTKEEIEKAVNDPNDRYKWNQRYCVSCAAFCAVVLSVRGGGVLSLVCH